MIKFVKETGCPSVSKVNNTENSRKSTVKYAEMYRNISQSPKVMSSNFGPPIIEDWDSEDEINALRSLHHDGLLKLIDDESFDVCVSCISGKMAKNPFTHASERAADLHGIIHSNGYALESAARILNLVPTKKVNKTTYEMWHGKVLNLSARIPQAPEQYGFYIDDEEHELGDHGEPPNYRVALSDPESEKWLKAMNAEMQSMKDNQVWNLVDLPPNCKTVGSKWLFKKKTNMDSNIHTYKARLIAKGFTQTYEVDYEENFSPVTDIKAIKILIAIAAYYDYEIWQIDVKPAFLNGRLNEDIYMVTILMQLNVDLKKSQGPSTSAEVKRMKGIPYAFAVGAVDWKSSKQSTTAMSSMESEYIVDVEAAMEAIWICKFIFGLGVFPSIDKPMDMYCNNTGAITIADEPGVQKDNSLADPFTKPMPCTKHVEHSRSIGLRPAVGAVGVIDEILEKDFDTLLDEGSKILHSIEGTILEEEIFSNFDKFIAMAANKNYNSESDEEEPKFKKITINTDYKIKTSLKEPPTDLKLKPHPDNLEYVFSEEPCFLPVIISSQLSAQNKANLYLSLKDIKKHLPEKQQTFLVSAHHSANTRYNF
ncbi:retrotransposon protein, putative, ty1-copia subclass [Tanacetum coccineum]